MRDYNVAGQIGLESSVDAYVAELVAVFREVRRVLRDDGTLWLNFGDSYATQSGAGTQGPTGQRANRTFTAEGSSAKGVPPGYKPKDLLGIPWRVAFALQADGWWLRSDIIWHKPNAMPESVTDRPTKAHEYLFLLAKSARYFYAAGVVREPQAAAGMERARYRRTGHAKDVYGDGVTNLRNPKTDAASRMREREGNGRNRRSVWTVSTRPFNGAHFATFPPDLIEPCVLAGSRPGDVVLDPFLGAGTTALVADRLGRDCVGIELNETYAALARERVTADAPLFAQVAD